MFEFKHDLAPYKKKYKCAHACNCGDCPGHVALFQYHATSDSFSVMWRLGERSEFGMSFDIVQFSLIEDFMNKLKGLEDET